MVSFIKKIGGMIANFWRGHKNFRRGVAVFMILYGFIALITPILPGSWLIIFGFEILGLKILFWSRFKDKFLGVFGRKAEVVISVEENRNKPTL